MSEFPDQSEFIARLKEGDDNATAQLVRAELPRLYNLCFRLCRQQQDTEDLCQQTFIKAIKGIKKFKGKSALSTWLYRIAINTWKNQIRYESKRPFQHSQNNIPDVPSQDDPGKKIAQKETRNDVLETLNQLKADDKMILLLRDIHEKSYEEISDIMEINLGTVKSRLSRAREQFRMMYQHTGAQHS